MALSLQNVLNNFSVYANGNKSDTMHTNYMHSFVLPFEHLNNSREITLALQRHWHWSIVMSLFYYMGIRLIERAMHNRKAFDLRPALFVWNASLALFSLVAFVRFSEDVLYQLTNHGFVPTICYSCHPERVAAFWAFLFLISKVVELGDTLFLVLRKRPVIFLHYYHHMAVLVCSAHVGADNAAPAMLFIPMNFFVHIFMYSYYALTTCGVRVPRWMAMCITVMQTIQMLSGVALTAFVLKLKLADGIRCQQSYGNLSLMVFLYFTFAILFMHLFYDHYLKKNGKKMKKQQQSKSGQETTKKYH